jgi:hypothetical protein
VLRVVILSSFFFLLLCLYSRSLAIGLVVCNMCYEGSLVAVSCKSLLLMENGLYFPAAKK